MVPHGDVDDERALFEVLADCGRYEPHAGGTRLRRATRSQDGIDRSGHALDLALNVVRGCGERNVHRRPAACHLPIPPIRPLAGPEVIEPNHVKVHRTVHTNVRDCNARKTGNSVQNARADMRIFSHGVGVAKQCDRTFRLHPNAFRRRAQIHTLAARHAIS